MGTLRKDINQQISDCERHLHQLIDLEKQWKHDKEWKPTDLNVWLTSIAAKTDKIKRTCKQPYPPVVNEVGSFVFATEAHRWHNIAEDYTYKIELIGKEIAMFAHTLALLKEQLAATIGPCNCNTGRCRVCHQHVTQCEC